jgi:hypothetical protein
MKIEEVIDKIKKSLSNLNLTTEIKSDGDYHVLYFTSNSKIHYAIEKEEENILSNIAFIKSKDGSFSTLDIDGLNSQIKEDLKKCDTIYHFDYVFTLKDQIVIIFERNLVEEIVLFCKDIILELSDVGFKTNITVNSDTNSNGSRSHSKPPKGVFIYIERHNKFKYLKDEKEKLILYKNRMENDYEQVELREYIDWLEDYLKDFGLKFTKDTYDYDNKQIKLCFQ